MTTHATESRTDSFDALDSCHRETLRMLQEFEAMVHRVDTHGPDAQARAMAAAVEQHFSGTMRAHHLDEERHVFPPLAAKGDEAMRHAVERLEQDHSWIEADWNELQPLVDAIACGQAWYDLESLRAGVDVLSALYRDHIALEESLIYPQAKARMDTPALDRMQQEMIARREVHAERQRRRKVY